MLALMKPVQIMMVTVQVRNFDIAVAWYAIGITA